MLNTLERYPLPTCPVSACADCKIAYDCVRARSRAPVNWHIAGWLIVVLLALGAQYGA